MVVLGCLSLWASPARNSPNQTIALDASVTILESANASGPVRLATEDLASDFEKVLGAKPKIVTAVEDAGPLTIVVAEPGKLPSGVRIASPSGTEAYSISVEAAKLGKKSAREIVLAGSDMRGTIYAIYEFSEKVLGVDPMYYWTDQKPQKRTSVTVPAEVLKSYPAPVFRYRGFFINDEDLLTGWAPGEKTDKTGIALSVWDKIYETTLRLKGNMVAPGTWIFPDEAQVRLAAKRGLIVTQHHAIPLGLNVARWPEDVPYNYSTHPEILEQAWKDAVNSYLPDQEVLWSVGLRGLSDVTYASMDPSVRGNNKALGALITKAITDQINIVRAVRPNAQFVTNLWQEGARLVQAGDLTIPKEVTKVWADDGYGYIQDGGMVSAGQGIYDHVAMMNGRANQLSEMVPVEETLSELGRYIKADATSYLLLNTSDIRPVTMSTKLVMQVAANGLPPGGADQFYTEWTTQQFGEKAAAAVTEVYHDYFRAPGHFTMLPGTNAPPASGPPRELGDQFYQTEARRMMLTYMLDWPLYGIAGQAPKWEPPRRLDRFLGTKVDRRQMLQEMIARDTQECGDAQPRWDALWQKAQDAETLVAPERKQFYRAAVLTMIAANRDGNRALYLVAKAIGDAQNGNSQAAEQEAAEAKTALDEALQFQHEAEYGKWKNFYRGDWLAGIFSTRQLLDVFANYLADPETHLVPPVSWDEAYYHIMHYEGDRSADVK